jgi:tetrahydromethanopterin S-methyltransferase subunit G
MEENANTRYYGDDIDKSYERINGFIDRAFLFVIKCILIVFGLVVIGMVLMMLYLFFTMNFSAALLPFLIAVPCYCIYRLIKYSIKQN